MLREALEIIRLLWQGGYQSYDGKYLDLEDARVFDLPDAAARDRGGGRRTGVPRIAAELGDGLFATEPKAELVEAYRDAGGTGPRYAEVPAGLGADEETAVRGRLETTRWALTGWKVMSELPNPVNFDAAIEVVRAEDILARVRVRPGPRPVPRGGPRVRRRGLRPRRPAERRPRPRRVRRLLRQGAEARPDVVTP